MFNFNKKVQVGNDKEKAQPERKSHSENRGGKKQIENKALTLRKRIVSRLSSYFPLGGHSVTRT